MDGNDMILYPFLIHWQKVLLPLYHGPITSTLVAISQSALEAGTQQVHIPWLTYLHI